MLLPLAPPPVGSLSVAPVSLVPTQLLTTRPKPSYTVRVGRGRIGRALGVAVGPVLAANDRRPGRQVRGAVPAGVGPRLPRRVVVHRVGDVAGRVGRLGRAPLGVPRVEADEV